MIDLGGLAHEFGAEREVVPTELDVCGLSLDEVQFPSSSTGREQRLSVADVADWLSVVAAGLASGQVREHQPFAERRRDRKGEDEPHRHVDDAKDAWHESHHQASREWWARVVGHGDLLSANGGSAHCVSVGFAGSKRAGTSAAAVSAETTLKVVPNASEVAATMCGSFFSSAAPSPQPRPA